MCAHLLGIADAMKIGSKRDSNTSGATVRVPPKKL